MSRQDTLTAKDDATKAFTEKDALTLVNLFDDFIEKRAKFHYNNQIESNLSVVKEPEVEYQKK